MHVRYSPLGQQFADIDDVLAELKKVVQSGDLTLGKVVTEFETAFSAKLGVKHAIGVGSGTDALKIPLKGLGIGPGDEVITSANTFWATVGAIAEVGATPVFIDTDDSFCTPPELIEPAITDRTKAIMPVHLSGEAADMPAIMNIAEKHGLPVVEDSCQSLMGTIDGKRVGSFGIAGAFSMHPLKIINVWGDAGIIVTNDDAFADQLRLLRNHGLKNRDEMVMFGYNSRLDSSMAVVGNWILPQIDWIVETRAKNAAYYDAGFKDVPGIRIPPRSSRSSHVYLLYVLFAENRDGLLQHCLDAGIEAKVHYPIPLYRQKALAHLGHKAGDFPVTDRHALDCITFPVDQHLTTEEMDYVISTVRDFYKG